MQLPQPVAQPLHRPHGLGRAAPPWRPGGAKPWLALSWGLWCGRRCVALGLRARNDQWFESVKTTELEEALRVLGFDQFPKMKSRQQLAKWIQRLRIPYELVEGAVQQVRRLRKVWRRKTP